MNTTKNIDVLIVANTILKYFIDREKPIKNMKLQKLLYFLCGYEYAIQDRWLIDSDFEAWPYGPVCPPVYYAVSRYNNGIITKLIPKIKTLHSYNLMSDNIFYSLFNAVIEKYGPHGDWVLSDMTHRPDTPWSDTIDKGHIGDIISKEMIKKHFDSLLVKKK